MCARNAATSGPARSAHAGSPGSARAGCATSTAATSARIAGRGVTAAAETPSATRSGLTPPGDSCITFVNNSIRYRSAMSARYCFVPFQPAATVSKIDDPSTSAAITRRACARHTTPPRAAATTPVALLSISARGNRAFTGTRGWSTTLESTIGAHESSGVSPTRPGAVIVMPRMCAATGSG